MNVELLLTPTMPRRAKRLFTALSAELKQPCSLEYKGEAEWLFMWGPGGELQQKLLSQHRAKGGQVAMFDVGYFQRYEDAARLTLNGFHPPAYLPLGLHRRPRFGLMGVETDTLYSPTGHILLCGTGVKSRALYGTDSLEWERRALSWLNHTHPGVPVVFRPKPKHEEVLEGTIDGRSLDIKHWLTGCRLAVMQHSNVQVDALRYDVPFQCEGGILSGRLPSEATREELLEAVSWFNYKPEEVGLMLDFLKQNEDNIRQIAKGG